MPRLESLVPDYFRFHEDRHDVTAMLTAARQTLEKIGKSEEDVVAVSHAGNVDLFRARHHGTVATVFNSYGLLLVLNDRWVLVTKWGRKAKHEQMLYRNIIAMSPIAARPPGIPSALYVIIEFYNERETQAALLWITDGAKQSPPIRSEREAAVQDEAARVTASFSEYIKVHKAQ